MAKEIHFTKTPVTAEMARIGGGALIGGVADWPAAPDGTSLTLVASLPAAFINAHAGMDLPGEKFVSVFSYYDPEEYILDCITYHGSAEELAWLRQGYTRVILHDRGAEQFGGVTIPAQAIELDAADIVEPVLFQGSKIGGAPGLLQAQPLALDGQAFVLQFYGGCFPKPFIGIFGLSDAVGYLFMSTASPGHAGPVDAGTFFVQAT